MKCKKIELIDRPRRRWKWRLGHILRKRQANEPFLGKEEMHYFVPYGFIKWR
jgi:hypothetical protein